MTGFFDSLERAPPGRAFVVGREAAGEVRRGGVDSHAGVHPKGTCFAACTGSE